MGSTAPTRKSFACPAAPLPHIFRDMTNSHPRDPHRMESDDVLRIKLEVLRREHRDLDDAVQALHNKGTVEPLTLQRLKRRKLALKDAIAALEDRLTPDIIA